MNVRILKRRSSNRLKRYEILPQRTRAVGTWAVGWGLGFVFVLSAAAADRTQCYLPSESKRQSARDVTTADMSIAKAGLSPTEAMGIDDQSKGGDANWRRYLELWRAHSEAPELGTIRRWLGLPLDGEVQISARKGRGSPRFLPWGPASFAIVQTPHFEILTRAGEFDSKQVARDLERIYWVWTQLYFPLWSGRDQTAVTLSDWDPDATSADEFLSLHARSRLSFRQRHRVVLLPDDRTYQQTISQAPIAAGNSSAIAASTGFYSDSLTTSFFFPQADRSSMVHEVCHQLFEEATDRPRSKATTSKTHDFWLVEGIAGHFESLQYGEQLASVGGWDSSRLQFARYRTLIARQEILPISELRGLRTQIQQRTDLARWYSQSILHTHAALDNNPTSQRRVNILAMLAEVYDVDVKDFASLQASDSEATLNNDRIDGFLMVDDQHLLANPITGNATEICLAACDISDRGWEAVPPLPHVKWFDASRTAIGDAAVQRLISDPSRLDQLSLEATKITPAIGPLIGRATELRELDLSWTAIDDSVVESIAECPSMKTLWLTGTPITDEAVAVLGALPHLETIDIQRTQISAAGLQRLGRARPDLTINPLQL